MSLSKPAPRIIQVFPAEKYDYQPSVVGIDPASEFARKLAAGAYGRPQKSTTGTYSRRPQKLNIGTYGRPQKYTTSLYGHTQKLATNGNAIEHAQVNPSNDSTVIEGMHGSFVNGKYVRKNTPTVPAIRTAPAVQPAQACAQLNPMATSFTPSETDKSDSSSLTETIAASVSSESDSDVGEDEANHNAVCDVFDMLISMSKKKLSGMQNSRWAR